MLYLGSNNAVGETRPQNDNGLPQNNNPVARIEEDIKLFEEKRTIVRQGIHYAEFCSDLAREENPEIMGYLTGVLRDGVQNLANLEVKDKNAGFLRDSVDGLADNFEEAATSAKRRAREKAETKQKTQSQKDTLTDNRNGNIYDVSNVERNLKKALEQVSSPDSPELAGKFPAEKFTDKFADKTEKMDIPTDTKTATATTKADL